MSIPRIWVIVMMAGGISYAIMISALSGVPLDLLAIMVAVLSAVIGVACTLLQIGSRHRQKTNT